MGIVSRKTGIEHLDTNIMIRLIARDNEKMLKRIEKLLSHEDKLYVFEDATMMEVVYVLSTSLYHYSREIIAEKIKEVMSIKNIVFNKSVIEGALDLYVSHPKLSFVDCYLVILSETNQETPLWTFDKKLIAQCPVAREP